MAVEKEADKHAEDISGGDGARRTAESETAESGPANLSGWRGRRPNKNLRLSAGTRNGNASLIDLTALHQKFSHSFSNSTLVITDSFRSKRRANQTKAAQNKTTVVTP